jgi:WD40 repeat protein
VAEPFSQLPSPRSPARRGRKPVASSSKKTLIISIIVALHVIPITVIVLILCGGFKKTPPPEPVAHPEVIVKHSTTPPPSPPAVAARAIPKPPVPPLAANPWDLPPVLPPAGLQSLLISGANPPLPTGGASLPAQVAPVIRDFETRHVGPVYALAILPGGKYLLSGGADRHIRAWDAATGRQVRVFDGTPHIVRSLTINGLGSAAASGGDDGAIRIWDLALGKEAFALTGHTGLVRGVMFSPNGQYILSGGEDGTIRLWDVQSRETVRNLKLGQPVTCVAFCADGRRALVGGDNGTIAIFDLEAAKLLHTTTGHVGAAVTAVAFSRDGREAVSVGTDKKILLWDVATGGRLPIGGKRDGTAIKYARPPQAIAYAGDGSWVLAAVADSSAAVVQPHGPGRTRISMPPLGTPLALAVAPDGSAAYFGTDQGAVRRMDFQGGTDTIATNSGRTDSPMSDPMTSTATNSKRAPALAPKWTADAGGIRVRSLSVAANGRAVTGGNDRYVRVWDANGKEAYSFPNMTGSDNGVGMTRDGGTILVGGNAAGPVGRLQIGADCMLRSVTLKFNKVTTVGLHAARINCLALSANGHYALTGCDNLVRYWDAGSGRELRQYLGHTGAVKGVDFHPRLPVAVSVAMDGAARFWDLNGTKMLRMIEGVPTMPAGVAYSPDGKSILVWGAGALGAWDAVTGASLRGVAAAARRIGVSTVAAAWAPDGNIVVAGSNGIELIDTATGKELRQFDSGPAMVDVVCVSGDGRFVVAAGQGICGWELDKPLIPGADGAGGQP